MMAPRNKVSYPISHHYSNQNCITKTSSSRSHMSDALNLLATSRVRIFTKKIENNHINIDTTHTYSRSSSPRNYIPRQYMYPVKEEDTIMEQSSPKLKICRNLLEKQDYKIQKENTNIYRISAENELSSRHSSISENDTEEYKGYHFHNIKRYSYHHKAFQASHSKLRISNAFRNHWLSIRKNSKESAITSSMSRNTFSKLMKSNELSDKSSNKFDATTNESSVKKPHQNGSPIRCFKEGNIYTYTISTSSLTTGQQCTTNAVETDTNRAKRASIIFGSILETKIKENAVYS